MKKFIVRSVLCFCFFYLVGAFYLYNYASARNGYPTIYKITDGLTRSKVNKLGSDYNNRFYCDSDKTYYKHICSGKWKDVKNGFQGNKKLYRKYRRKYVTHVKHRDNPYKYNYPEWIWKKKVYETLETKTNENIISDSSENKVNEVKENVNINSDSKEDITNSYLLDIRTILICLGCLLSLMYGSIMGLHIKRKDKVIEG